MTLYRALLDISLPTIVVAVLGMPETIIGFLEYLLFLNMNMTQSNAKEKKYQKSIQLINTLDAKDKIDNIIKCLFEEFEDWIFCGFYIEKDNSITVKFTGLQNKEHSAIFSSWLMMLLNIENAIISNEKSKAIH